MTQAPASVQEYSGNRQITVIPTMTEDHTLIGNATGTVTADSSAQGFKSGATALRVNDRAVVALHTAIPLFRDLGTGDVGGDVAALNNELNRLGYRSSPGSRQYSSLTQQGWKQLMAAVGNDSDGSLSLADVLWIPSSAVSPSSWTGAMGTPVRAGAPLGRIPGTLVRLTIKNVAASNSDQQLNVFGQRTTLKAGATAVDDPAWCRAVAQTEAFRQALQGDVSAGLNATLSLPKTVSTLRVPAAAVFGIKDDAGCIMADDSTIKVRILASELGASLVRLDDDARMASISSVRIGSPIAGARCS